MDRKAAEKNRMSRTRYACKTRVNCYRSALEGVHAEVQRYAEMVVETKLWAVPLGQQHEAQELQGEARQGCWFTSSMSTGIMCDNNVASRRT